MMRPILFRNLIRHVSAIVVLWAACVTALADPPPPMDPPQYEPQVDVRNGGVLAESYGYHRHQTARPTTYPPKNGWYGYGFPVNTFRWGWFGAEHYYPRVGWHAPDYNGDCVRWAYRRGY